METRLSLFIIYFYFKVEEHIANILNTKMLFLKK